MESCSERSGFPRMLLPSVKNLITQEEFIRSVMPEAEITINNKTYSVRWIVWPKEKAYLKEEWIPINW